MTATKEYLAESELQKPNGKYKQVVITVRYSDKRNVRRSSLTSHSYFRYGLEHKTFRRTCAKAPQIYFL